MCARNEANFERWKTAETALAGVKMQEVARPKHRRTCETKPNSKEFLVRGFRCQARRGVATGGPTSNSTLQTDVSTPHGVTTNEDYRAKRTQFGGRRALAKCRPINELSDSAQVNDVRKTKPKRECQVRSSKCQARRGNRLPRGVTMIAGTREKTKPNVGKTGEMRDCGFTRSRPQHSIVPIFHHSSGNWLSAVPERS
jgi:hypothetical protein